MNIKDLIKDNPKEPKFKRGDLVVVLDKKEETGKLHIFKKETGDTIYPYRTIDSVYQSCRLATPEEIKTHELII